MNSLVYWDTLEIQRLNVIEALINSCNYCILPSLSSLSSTLPNPLCGLRYLHMHRSNHSILILSLNQHYKVMILLVNSVKNIKSIKNEDLKRRKSNLIKFCDSLRV